MSNNTQPIINHQPSTINRVFQTIQPPKKTGRWARPQVTMNARGQMKLNRVAFELLGEPDYVRVLFDEQSQTIALKPANETNDEAHELIAHGVHGRHGGRLIKLYGIHEHIEGELYTCIRFKDIRMENGRLILELAKAVPAFNGTRIGMFKVWQENQRKKERVWNKRTYEAHRNRTGKRTWEEFRSEQALASIERANRIQATKQRLRAERDLARNTRKLEKERAARIARDKQYQDLVDDLKRRKEELEAIRRPFIEGPPQG